MKKLLIVVILFSSAFVFVRSDPNIYGPGGVNLGPNGGLPPTAEELKKDKLLEEEREKTRLLQAQVQELQEQVEQLQQQLQYQQEMQWNLPYPLQIDINYGYPYQPNYGWIWGGPFVGGGFGETPFDRDHHRGNRGGHHGRGGPRGRGGHLGQGGPRGGGGHFGQGGLLGSGGHGRH